MDKLREKIAKIIWLDGADWGNSYDPGCETASPPIEFNQVDQILTLIKEAGYVKLADDQSLPENPKANTKLGNIDYHYIRGKLYYRAFDNIHTVYKQAQQDMLKQGWRKVIDS